jgi:GT2 family glycosyltransferase
VKTFGIVVPTLGTRPNYLKECLHSLTAEEGLVVCVVAPRETFPILDLPSTIIHADDPGIGVAAAINIGFERLEEVGGIEWVTWIGDDDRLAVGSLSSIRDSTDEIGVVAVVGQCHYVDTLNQTIFIAKPNKLAVCLLEYGPNLLPQPGSFYLASVLRKVGYLNPNLRFAFDQDLFHRLKKEGEIKTISKHVSWYRWHPDSLSYSGKSSSETESHQLRMKYCPRPLLFIPLLWHYAHRLLSRYFRPILSTEN